MNNSYFPSFSGSVTGGSGAFGAWSTIATTGNVPLCGFYLAISGAATNSYGIFNLFIGSGTPGTPNIQYGIFDGNFTGFVYFPLFVPPNTAIQVQTWNMNATTDAQNTSVIGVPAGVCPSHNKCQVLGTSTTNNFLAVGTTATSFGTTLDDPLKRLAIVGGNSSASGFYSTFTLSIGSAGATDIIQNIPFGDPGTDYISSAYEFDLFLPPSQDIWLTSGNSASRAMMYLFY